MWRFLCPCAYAALRGVVDGPSAHDNFTLPNVVEPFMKAWIRVDSLTAIQRRAEQQKRLQVANVQMLQDVYDQMWGPSATHDQPVANLQYRVETRCRRMRGTQVMTESRGVHGKETPQIVRELANRAAIIVFGSQAASGEKKGQRKCRHVKTPL